MDHETTLSAPQVGSLAAAVDKSGPLAFADVLTMGADVASDLSGRTTGHGGVQPQSIERRASGAWLLTAPGLALDPAAARAPELAADDTPTPAGDVYALGATLVFALTGQAFDDAGFGGDAGDAGAASEPADSAEPGPPESAAAGHGGAGLVPQSLPDVMALFLDTLRRTLAIDPGSRISAGGLAGTLRQLRNDADRVMNPPPPTSAMSAAVGGAAGAGAAAAGGADPAFAAGLLAVDGATAAADGSANKTWQERLPMIVAAVAVIVAIVAVALVLRKGDNNNVVAAGPSTNVSAVASSTTIPLLVLPVGTETSTTTSTSTTTTRPNTTVPVVIPPPPTVPPSTTPPAGTQAVTVDMANMVNCPGCLASLRSQPSLLSQLTAQFPDKTTLWGQCWTTGDTTHDDVGYTSNQWIYIVGPVSQGWVPIHLVGRQIYGLPACPQSTTQPSTTRPTTTLPPSTTTTVGTTTTTRGP